MTSAVLLANAGTLWNTIGARYVFYGLVGYSLYMGLALSLTGTANGIHTPRVIPEWRPGWVPDGEMTHP